MKGFQSVAAAAGAVLAALLVAVPAAPATAARPGGQAHPDGQARPPFVPCPRAAQPSPPPARPSPPGHDTRQPTIGGEGLGTAGLAVPSGSAPLPGNLSAASWVVADLDSGAVLGACGPHEGSPPASVQKLLLAETVLPKLDPAQVVDVTQDDLNFERGSSAVGLVVGGHYPVETLWLGLLLESGNDTANVLARLGGGSAGVPGTVEAMNTEAHRLGAWDTHAVTPSGLDGPGQFTSAYDLALIARADFAREDFRRYTATLRAQIPPQPPKKPRGFEIQNENLLLTKYPGAIGGKTGFTTIARHTYVGAAQRDGHRLVVTILGAEATPVRAWQQGAALLDWGFAARPGASVGQLVAPGEADRLVAPSPTGGGPKVASAVLAVRHTSYLTLTVLVLAAAAVVCLPAVALAALRRRRGRHVAP